MLSSSQYLVSHPKLLALLKEIVNCPYTSVLKMVDSLSDLSKLLINHPDYDQKGGRYYSDKSSLTHHVQVETIGIRAFQFIVRAEKLEMSDFREINLQNEITNLELKYLKAHIISKVWSWLRENSYISAGGTDLYTHPLVNKYFLNFIEKAHVAVALYKDDPFISLANAFKDLRVPYIMGNLRQGFTLSERLTDRALLRLSEYFYNALLFGTGNIVDDMKKLPYYYDAINALQSYIFIRKATKTAFGTFQFINKITASGYSGMWFNRNYKAWSALTLICDSAATDAISFEGFLDEYFDKSQKTGIYAAHHPDRKNKQSLSLNDLILTFDKYNPSYDSMPEESQFTLKEGIRKLFQMGIKKRGSGIDGLITADDIRNVFYGKVFTFNSPLLKGGRVHNIPILTEYGRDSNGKMAQLSPPGLWDYHFSRVSFGSKLNEFNNKIMLFRSTFKQTNSLKQAYMSIINLFPIAKSRFFDKAIAFSNRMLAGAFPSSSHYWRLTKFGDYNHMDLSRLLFILD